MRRIGNISSVVEKALRKHISEDIPDLKYNLSNNLEFRLFFPANYSKSFKEAKKIFLKNYLNDLLILSLGNVSLAAKKAHIHRRQFHRILNELEINPGLHRKELIKPVEYMRENIHTILEETLAGLNKDEKIKTIYSNLPDISEVISKNMEENFSYEEAIDLFEKEFISNALKENKYDISKTAENMDISERTLYRKISKFNIAII
jgi:DNA-binding NtrC family response regulator